jgi:hypothetical protein
MTIKNVYFMRYKQAVQSETDAQLTVRLLDTYAAMRSEVMDGKQLAQCRRIESLLQNMLARRCGMSIKRWWASEYAQRDAYRYIAGTSKYRQYVAKLNEYLHRARLCCMQGIDPPCMDSEYWQIVYHMPESTRKQYTQLGNKALSAAMKQRRLLAMRSKATQHGTKAQRAKRWLAWWVAHFVADIAADTLAQEWWARRNALITRDSVMIEARQDAALAGFAADREYDNAMLAARIVAAR